MLMALANIAVITLLSSDCVFHFLCQPFSRWKKTLGSLVHAKNRLEFSKPEFQGPFPELRYFGIFPEKGKVCLYVEQTDAKDQSVLEASVPVSSKQIVLRGCHDRPMNREHIHTVARPLKQPIIQVGGSYQSMFPVASVTLPNSCEACTGPSVRSLQSIIQRTAV
jgi:hypothetical protein